MGKARAINPDFGLGALLCIAVISILMLAYASGVTSQPFQTVILLVSMGLLFYSSHPLGHYFVARLLGASVDYFYLGRSEFRRLNAGVARVIGAYLPTVGTKLNKSKIESLTPRRRGYVYASGVIVSNTLVGIELAYALVVGFSFPAMVLGVVFLVGSVVTELLFSTKVGDLSKMKKQSRA